MAHQQYEAEGQRYFPMKGIPALAWSLTYKRYWLSTRQMSTFVVRLCAKAHLHTPKELRGTVVGAQITPRPVTGATSPSWVYLNRLRAAQGLSGMQELVFPSASNRGDWDLGQLLRRLCLNLAAGGRSTLHICIYMCVCAHRYIYIQAIGTQGPFQCPS